MRQIIIAFVFFLFLPFSAMAEIPDSLFTVKSVNSCFTVKSVKNKKNGVYVGYKVASLVSFKVIYEW